ncbi:hypothetical protein C3B79_2591 [Aeromonas hydrophila]|nr:hypothetical protein C3B79_2591 [Aeromonas hydrophila]
MPIDIQHSLYKYQLQDLTLCMRWISAILSENKKPFIFNLLNMVRESHSEIR